MSTPLFSWSRRQCLQGLSTLTAFVLAGCGSDSLADSTFTGGGAAAASPPVGNVQGTVNAREMGGQGLAVQSAYGPEALVVGGAFTTLGSSTGAQLLMVTDHQGVVRALGTSIPGSPVVIDARSTALALLLLTPGILATDPLEAGAQLAKLQVLAGFTALLSFLVQNLAGSSLATLLAGAELSGLLQTVIDQFQAPPVAPKFQALSLVTVTPAGPAAATVVTLANSGWRFVSVLRQPTDALGTGLVAAVKPNNLVGPQIPAPFTGEALLSGAQPASWGSLYGRQLFADATATETVDLTGGAAGVTYWFDGIGSGLNESLPSVGPFPIVENDFGSQAFGATIMFYLVFPVLDFAVGGADLLEAGPKGAAIVWAAVAGSTVSAADLIGAVRGGDPKAIKGAIVNLVHVMLVSSEILDAMLKVTLPSALYFTEKRFLGVKNLLKLNGVINQFFTAVNVGLAMSTWGLNARIGSVALAAPAGPLARYGVTLIQDGYETTGDAFTRVEASLNNSGDVLYGRLQNNIGRHRQIVVHKGAVEVTVDVPNGVTGLTNLSDTGHFAYSQGSLDNVSGLCFFVGASGQATPLTLGSLGVNPLAQAINILDEVVGSYLASVSSGFQKAFRWDPTSAPVDLRVPLSSPVIVKNNFGGDFLELHNFSSEDDGKLHLALHSGTAVVTLAAPPGINSFYLGDLNDAGQAVFIDHYKLAQDVHEPAHFYAAGVVSDLPLVPEAYSHIVTAMNNHGDAVGHAIDQPTQRRLCLRWSASGGVVDLQDLVDFSVAVPAGPMTPLDINDKGQILVYTEIGLQRQLVLLTPKKPV